MIGQPSTIHIPSIINEDKILIANLSKRIGEEPSHLLGALLVTAIAQAAEGRASLPEDQRRDFTLYVDEFQNFATDTFATILSEMRKWRLNLVLAKSVPRTGSRHPSPIDFRQCRHTGRLPRRR